MELTDAIRSYTEEKVDHLRKLCEEFDPADELEIEIGKSTNHHAKGPFYFAEMMLHIPGKDLYAKLEEEDLYKAIDMTKDLLWRQLSEHKDRLREKKRGVRPDKE